MDYGTGAIMAVPAHDERDGEFAERFDLPIVTVIDEDGKLVDSAQFTGLPADEAKARDRRLARGARPRQAAISYRLRDWGFSRQRYWGCPIPIVYCDDCGAVAVPDDELPVVAARGRGLHAEGIAPLASNRGLGARAVPDVRQGRRREVETMDTFVDSSWYFLRYCDPHNDDGAVRARARRLVVPGRPVHRRRRPRDDAPDLRALLHEGAERPRAWSASASRSRACSTNGWVQLGGTKMSKSKGNVIGPDALAREYGADAVRLYMLFMGPADEDMEWTDDGIEGMSRFVRRLYRLVLEVCERGVAGRGAGERAVAKAHETIARVTDDIGRRSRSTRRSPR